MSDNATFTAAEMMAACRASQNNGAHTMLDSMADAISVGGEEAKPLLALVDILRVGIGPKLNVEDEVQKVAPPPKFNLRRRCANRKCKERGVTKHGTFCHECGSSEELT